MLALVTTLILHFAQEAPPSTSTEAHPREASRGWSTRIERARAASAARDHAACHAEIRATVDETLARCAASSDPAAAVDLSGLADAVLEFGFVADVEPLRRAATLVLGRSRSEDDDDLCRARSQLAGAVADLGDFDGALALDEQVLASRTRTHGPEDPALLRARAGVAASLRQRGEPQRAREIYEDVLRVAANSLPADDPELQRARSNVATVLEDHGRHAEARALRAIVVEVRTRTLGADHLDTLNARAQLASSRAKDGEPREASVDFEAIVAAFDARFPAEHPDRARALLRFASALRQAGDPRRALALEESVLEIRERVLPPDHYGLQQVRWNVAQARFQRGDLEGTRVLEAQVVAARRRTMSPDHPLLSAALVGSATTLREMRRFDEALDLAREALLLRTEHHAPAQLVLEAREEVGLALAGRRDPGALVELEAVLAGRLSAAEPRGRDIQRTRAHVAQALMDAGDTDRARALLQAAVDGLPDSCPEDDPLRLAIRANLATAAFQLGDLTLARTLFEDVLALRERTLPSDHPSVVSTRLNLVGVLADSKRWDEAAALGEEIVSGLESTRGPDDPELCRARSNLAAALGLLGRHERARELQEQALATLERTRPPGDPAIALTRGNLASTFAETGDVSRALELDERVLADVTARWPDDYPDVLFAKTRVLYDLGARSVVEPGHDDGERAAELARDIAAAARRQALAALRTGSSREAEERCARLATRLDSVLACASGLGNLGVRSELDSAAFELLETLRGAAVQAASARRASAASPRLRELEVELAQLAEELAQGAQGGPAREAFRALVLRRESLEREIATLAAAAGSTGSGFDAARLASRLGPGTCAVAFARWLPTEFDLSEGPGGKLVTTRRARLVAFVLRGAADPSHLELARVDLGRAAVIEDAIRAWREAIASRVERGLEVRDGTDAALDRGRALAALVLGPLLPHLGDARRLVVALDHDLHLVALDALPLDAAGTLAGDRWRIETRCTLAELGRALPPVAEAGALLALGGASFQSAPLPASAEDHSLLETDDKAHESVRGGAWSRRFTPLSYTALEAREIATLHEEVFETEAPRVVLERRQASREGLVELAPRASWLHVATHGWFAPDSVRSYADAEDVRGVDAALRATSAEDVRGMSPMLLAGLALAGANLPEDEFGRLVGLVTAEEIATLDLARCELAVLSACDTNVGERRAGQGVASLQRALQIAGARSVITSLWKVPDEATRELMVDFYRRMWAEKKPKARALWEAKMALREVRDESGLPKYGVRDWAAWVLTGEPD